MQGYLNKGKEILKSLVNNGFEAYYYRETVRNSLLGLDCDCIYIITSAQKDDLNSIFNRYEHYINEDGTFSLVYEKYKAEIKSFEIVNVTSKNTQITKASSSLLDNLEKCDFTINALAMSSSGKITDAYDGYKDIKKKLIKSVGSAKQKFIEDPLQILHAFAIVSELNFTIHPTTVAGMKKRIKNLETLTAKNVCTEMKKILEGRYAKKALTLLNKIGIQSGLGILGEGCERFLNVKEFSYEEFIACAMILNGGINNNYLESIGEDKIEFYTNCISCAIANPKGKYDRLTIFSYGLDVCLTAFKLNKLIGKASGNIEKKLNKEYDKLPIKKKCDIKFKGQDIMRISDCRNAEIIGDLFEDLVYQVVTGALPNEYKPLEDYACGCLKDLNIAYDTSRQTIATIPAKESTKKPNSPQDELNSYNEFLNKIQQSHNHDSLDDDFDHPRGETLEDKMKLPEIKQNNSIYGNYESTSSSSGPFVENKPREYDERTLKTAYNEEYDDIDYSRYKDPKKPDFTNVNDRIYGGYAKASPFVEDNNKSYSNESYSFENDSVDENDNNANSEEDEIVYTYEHHVIDDETNKRLRLLEERVNAQDKLLREKSLELDKQRVATTTQRVVSTLMDELRKDQSLPDYVDKSDFQDRLNQFVSNYLSEKMRKDEQ